MTLVRLALGILLFYAVAARFAALAALAFARLATSAAFRAADIFLFAGAVFGSEAAFFDSAHLFRCASAIAFLPAALILRFALGSFGVSAGAGASDSPRTFAHLRFCASLMR